MRFTAPRLKFTILVVSVPVTETLDKHVMEEDGGGKKRMDSLHFEVEKVTLFVCILKTCVFSIYIQS